MPTPILNVKDLVAGIDLSKKEDHTPVLGLSVVKERPIITSNKSKKSEYCTKSVLVGMGIMCLILGLISCVSQAAQAPRELPPDPTPKVEAVKIDLGNIATGVSGATTQINTDVQQGMAKTPETAKATLFPHWLSILGQTGIIDTYVKQIRSQDSKLTAVQEDLTKWKEFAKTETERANKEKTRADKAESSATKQLKEKYTWISVACFAGFVICSALAASGWGNSKLAISGAIACAAGLGLAIALVQTVQMIPWIVGAIIVVGGGLIIWQVFIKNKAITEIVHTTEVAKALLPEAARKQVFGDEAIPGHAYSIQSTSTEKLVAATREKVPTTSSMSK